MNAQRGQWSRRVAGLAAVVLLARCGAPGNEGTQGGVGEARQAAVSTLTFAPVADGAVQSAYPAQSFGTGAWLQADTSPAQESYLRFSVSGVSGTVTSAKLRLYASDGTSDGPALYPVASGWTEASLTWNTRPARTGAALSNLATVDAGTYVEYDVTALVKGDGTYDLGLVPDSSNGADFASRESSDAARRPQLVLTVDSGGTTEEPPPPPPPPPPGDGEVKTLTPYQDATAASATPSTSACCRAYLSADTSPLEESYLGFDLRALGGTVASAKLRLYVTDGTSDGPRVHRVTGSWSASTLTWSARPAYEATPLANAGALGSGTWVEYDVTSAVRTGETFSVVLVADSSNGTDVASMESADASLRPQLVVTLAGTTTEPLPPPPPGDCMPRVDTFADQGYRTGDLGTNTLGLSDQDVAQDAPDTSYARAPVLRSDLSPRLETYLHFRVDAQPPAEGTTIRSAKLRLYVLDSTSDAPAVYLTAPWAERALTWNTRPSLTGSAIGNLGAISAGTWVEYDVTRGVQADGTYGLALIPESTNGADFASVEYVNEAGWGGYGPQLNLVRETPSYCSYHGTGGTTRVAKQHGGSADERVDATAAHPQGGLVVAGRTAAGGTFGGESFGAAGMVLARYAADGTHVWSRLVAQGEVEPVATVVTPEGNTLVTGTYGGAPDFGVGPLPSARTNGLFVAKFGPSGQLVWSRGFIAGYTREDYSEWPIQPRSIATDAQGSLIVGGAFYGEMDLGGGRLFAGTASTAYDDNMPGGFVARFSWDGQHVWSRALEGGYGANDAQANDVATDASGNVYVAGDGGSNTDLGDGVKGSANAFLAKYSPQGALLWKRGFDGYGTLSEVAPLADGRVLFVGRFGETFTFGGQTIQASDYYQHRVPFLGALDAGGRDLWIQRETSREPERLFALPDGGWLMTGELAGTSDLGGGELGTTTLLAAKASAARLPYAARYRADRGHVWSRTFDNALGGMENGLAPPVGRLAPALTAEGALVLGAKVLAPVELDGQQLTSRGGNDVLLLFLAP